MVKHQVFLMNRKFKKKKEVDLEMSNRLVVGLFSIKLNLSALLQCLMGDVVWGGSHTPFLRTRLPG